MSRKRAPEHDWICRRCLCPCMPPGHPEQRHIGGGQGMKACKLGADPILRSEHDAEVSAVVGAIRSRR